VLLEFVGCAVVQANVGTHRVVVVPSSVNDDGGLLSRSEPLQRLTLVAHLAVEAFLGSVLPRLAGIAHGGCVAKLGDPLQDGAADELRSVARAHEQ